MRHTLRNLTLAGVLAASVSTAALAAGVDVKSVRFQSGGETLAGDLYVPADAQGAPRPALVVTGAWMTVRQQMPARYAREMAERGFVALTFDFRNWGESGGARRQFEDPRAKIADIKAAVGYLATRPEVDKERIGGLGVCASSGYLVDAAAETPDIRSVAVVAPWFQDAEVVDEIYKGPQAVAALIAEGDKAEAEYRRTGKQVLVPAASTTDERAVMFKVPYYTEADRGMIPAWRNETDLGFWRGWLTYYSMDAAARLRQPFLMVESEAAAAPQGAHKFYARLNAPKQELWLENVSQLDFYDRPEPVTKASDAAAEHFRTTLGMAAQ